MNKWHIYIKLYSHWYKWGSYKTEQGFNDAKKYVFDSVPDVNEIKLINGNRTSYYGR